MNLRTVIVMDWDGRDGVQIESLSAHKSLKQPMQVIQGTPLTAIKAYIAAVEQTEKRWQGIPD